MSHLSSEAQARKAQRPPEIPFISIDFGFDQNTKTRIKEEVVVRLDQIVGELDLCEQITTPGGPMKVPHELVKKCKVSLQLFKRYITNWPVSSGGLGNG